MPFPTCGTRTPERTWTPLEAIARKTPLSRQHRPQWDLRVLSRFGIQASADENIWQRVWTKEERINNASTPMFLIEGRKAGLLES